MPIYEYKCVACGHQMERIQKFSPITLETCPQCGGLAKKLISKSTFQLKGTGWYATDYAKKEGAKDECKTDGPTT